MTEWRSQLLQFGAYSFYSPLCRAGIGLVVEITKVKNTLCLDAQKTESAPEASVAYLGGWAGLGVFFRAFGTRLASSFISTACSKIAPLVD